MTIENTVKKELEAAENEGNTRNNVISAITGLLAGAVNQTHNYMLMKSAGFYEDMEVMSLSYLFADHFHRLTSATASTGLAFTVYVGSQAILRRLGKK